MGALLIQDSPVMNHMNKTSNDKTVCIKVFGLKFLTILKDKDPHDSHISYALIHMSSYLIMDLLINNSYFVNTVGTVIYIRNGNGNFFLSNCKFINSSSSHRGTVIINRLIHTFLVQIKHCAFIDNNNSARKGGVICAGNVTLFIQNSFFIHNMNSYSQNIF